MLCIGDTHRSWTLSTDIILVHGIDVIIIFDYLSRCIERVTNYFYWPNGFGRPRREDNGPSAAVEVRRDAIWCTAAVHGPHLPRPSVAIRHLTLDFESSRWSVFWDFVVSVRRLWNKKKNGSTLFDRRRFPQTSSRPIRSQKVPARYERSDVFPDDLGVVTYLPTLLGAVVHNAFTENLRCSSD